MYWIREAVPNLTEDEEYRGPVQEPPTKDQSTGRRHAEEQTHRGPETFLCLLRCIIIL